jgi:uncharacterized protein YjbI with pentapeptide repeats
LGQEPVRLETPPQSDGRHPIDAHESVAAEPQAPTPPASSDLPPIAAKADDLEAIRKAVDDAAAVSGALWFSYLFALLYFAVAAGAVTHEDLFFERPVKLPFLGIDLPLLAFFFLAPILFVLGHVYTLVHLVMLAHKAKRYDESLDDQIKEGGDFSTYERAVRANIHAGLRQQLPSNIFVQFLAGPRELRESWFGWTLRAIGWSTLVIAPVLLLLLMQIQFLPFHSKWIAWTQRAALAGDLFFIWWLWSRVLSGREAGRLARKSAHWRRAAVGVLSVGALLFSWTVATFPGEWQEALLPSWPVLPAIGELSKEEKGSLRDWVFRATRLSLHDWLFAEQPDAITRRRFPFSSTLVLPGLNIYEGLGIDDPEKGKWREFVFRARGRDLKGAIFDLATLPKVDFDGADLKGASLEEAQLQGTSFYGADLKGARLNEAKLQGVPFNEAHLQGASLAGAQLQGASFRSAHLQGASLFGAQLQGASLFSGQLQGASLDSAQLQGAYLAAANRQGTSLNGAALLGASLFSARLQGASLVTAQLRGASLQRALLEGTDLSFAYLWRTNNAASADDVSNLAAGINLPRAVRLPDAVDTWRPLWGNSKPMDPWNDKAYQGLREMMQSIPQGERRNQAIDRIRSLDCSNPDPRLAACDPSVAPPPEAAAWQGSLEAVRVDEAGFAKALAAQLKTLVCSHADDAVYVLRALMPDSQWGRNPFNEARPEMPALVDFIMSKDCPVSASLTGPDQAKLLRIKRDAEKVDK